MRISDWNADVCPSDLADAQAGRDAFRQAGDIQTLLGDQRFQRRRRIGGEKIIDIVLDHGELAARRHFGDGGPAFRAHGRGRRTEFGRASCWESVCTAVYIWVADVSWRKETDEH